MITLAIFDFDDTLVNNIELDFKAFDIPCKKLGLKSPDKNKIIKMRKKGFLAKQIMENYLKNSEKDVMEVFLNERKKFLKTESIKYLKLKPNLKSLLEFLKKKKIKIVICTANKNKSTVLNFIKKKSLNKYFSEILFMDDLGFKLDNSTASNRILIKTSLIKNVLKKFVGTKDEIVFVGNSVEDLKSAKKMKVPFIYFQNFYLPKLKNNRIKIIYSMLELKKYFLEMELSN